MFPTQRHKRTRTESFWNTPWGKHAVDASGRGLFSHSLKASPCIPSSEVLRAVLSLKPRNVKLPKAAFVVHVADLSEDGPLRPALVVDSTNRPHTTYRWETWWGLELRLSGCDQRRSEGDFLFLICALTDKAVRVLAVQLVAIIQVQGDGERLLGRRCPLQNLLGPVHPEEAVHLSLRHHLILKGAKKRHIRRRGLYKREAKDALCFRCAFTTVTIFIHDSEMWKKYKDSSWTVFN